MDLHYTCFLVIIHTDHSCKKPFLFFFFNFLVITQSFSRIQCKTNLTTRSKESLQPTNLSKDPRSCDKNKKRRITNSNWQPKFCQISRHWKKKKKNQNKKEKNKKLKAILKIFLINITLYQKYHVNYS